MSKLAGIVTVIICVSGIVGCHERLVHQITCDKVAALRLGQTQAEVKLLLGSARFEHWGDDLSLAPYDTEWFYSTDRAVTFPYGGFDWFEVHFREGRLVGAGAFQKSALAVRLDSEPTAAFHLDYREEVDASRIRREFGPAFDSVFPCPPGVQRDQLAGAK